MALLDAFVLYLEWSAVFEIVVHENLDLVDHVESEHVLVVDAVCASLQQVVVAVVAAAAAVVAAAAVAVVVDAYVNADDAEHK